MCTQKKSSGGIKMISKKTIKKMVMIGAAKKILFAVVLIAMNSFAFGAPEIQDILVKLDDLMEMKTDARAKVTITQQKSQQGTKVSDMVYYRRDKDDAFMIAIAAPESEKGNGYLKVGDNFWMYRKNTRTFQHINRDESIGGSDAKGDDFEKKKMTELYEGVKGTLTDEMLGKIAVYKFELKAKVTDVDYPKKVYWVEKDTFLPRKEQSYSASGTLMETAYYLKYAVVDGRYVATLMRFIDEFEKGNQTMVEISGISTAKLDDSIFTKAYLENLSK